MAAALIAGLPRSTAGAGDSSGIPAGLCAADRTTTPSDRRADIRRQPATCQDGRPLPYRDDDRVRPGPGHGGRQHRRELLDPAGYRSVFTVASGVPGLIFAAWRTCAAVTSRSPVTSTCRTTSRLEPSSAQPTPARTARTRMPNSAVRRRPARRWPGLGARPGSRSSHPECAQRTAAAACSQSACPVPQGRDNQRPELRDVTRAHGQHQVTGLRQAGSRGGHG